MTDSIPNQAVETPCVEVRVYRHDELVLTELCESEEEAAQVMSQWSEHEGVRCEVDDLTPKNGLLDSSEPRSAVAGDEEYPHTG